MQKQTPHHYMVTVCKSSPSIKMIFEHQMMHYAPSDKVALGPLVGNTCYRRGVSVPIHWFQNFDQQRHL